MTMESNSYYKNKSGDEEDKDDNDVVNESNDVESTCVSSYSDRKHLVDILSLTGPIILSEIFHNTLPIVDIAFIGRLTSKEDLAAAALATVWFNLWNNMMLGFLTAVDTLLSQSFGAQEYEVFSMWTGTSLILVSIVTFLVGGLIALCHPMMVAFGQNPELARAAGQFSYRLLPGLLPFYYTKVLVKYLHAQNVLIPPTIIALMANGFNALSNWLLISYFKMGLNGAPIATTITRYIEFILIVAYVFWKKSNKLSRTWPSISKQNIKRESIITFLKMGSYSALSLVAEAWSFEITTILAGLLGTEALDAHTITLSIATFIYLSFPFAIGIATSIRVGQLTGEGRATDAKRSSIISFVLSTVVQGILIIAVILLSKILGELFSNDENVSTLIGILLPLSCIFMMGDAIQANAGGALRGLGQQKILLLLNIIGFWMLALPCGALLTFVADLGVRGLWWGMTIGIYSSSIIGILLLRFYIKWEHETVVAKNRIASIKES